MAAGDILHAVGSILHSRHAAKFIATADQAIVIDAFAVTRQAAADAAGTFSAWVMIPDAGDYSIISCGDTAAIEFLTLRITANKLVVELNDATVDKFEYTSTDIVITPHTWHHVAVTQDGVKPRLFVDGKRVAQTEILGTDPTLWFAALALIDDASIGAAEEAGAAAQIRECKGGISDVKYWKVALTDAEVARDFAGAAPTGLGKVGIVSQLTNWWDMDGDAVDSVAGEDGAAGASILFLNEYSEFTSRFAFLGVVAADDISVSVNDKEGHCVIVKAA